MRQITLLDNRINKKQDEIKTKINELITKITNFDGVWIGLQQHQHG